MLFFSFPSGWTGCDVSDGVMLPAVPGTGQQPGSGFQTVLEEEESDHSSTGHSLSDEVCECVLLSVQATLYNTVTVMSLHSMC